MKYAIGAIVTAVAFFAMSAFAQPAMAVNAKKAASKGQQPAAQTEAVSPDSTSAPDKISSFQASGEWKKLDSRLQAAWVSAMKNDPTQRLDCFVRLQAPGDRGDQSFLISKGYNVRIFAGTIASGWLAAQDLPEVARLPFVMSINLATK